MEMEYQEAMALVKAGKCDTESSNNKLIKALSHGWLWHITDTMQRLFALAEKIFCIDTSRNNIRKINVFLMVKKLMEFSPIQDNFKSAIEAAEIEISKEVSKNVLYSILTLYICIQSFIFLY